MSVRAPLRPLLRAAVVRRPLPPGAAVGFLDHREAGTRDEHERASLSDLALRLARLKGLPCIGRLDDTPRQVSPATLYVVAPDTLLTDEARAFGITRREDLFGGVVAHRVHATKAIAHPLVPDALVAPAGWREGLAQRVVDVVLPGYSAFCKRDARRALTRLLVDGPVRLKACGGRGGSGQWTVHALREADALLERFDEAELEREGLVCELDLAESRTFSVGQVDVGACRISYCGVQRQIPRRSGARVYGGSELLVVRGEFEDLLRLGLPASVRLAVRQARWFDNAVGEWLPELIVSRNNYDVIQGHDRDGRARSAVLEQSWRPGGASAAEIAALEHFDAHGDVGVLRVAVVERYGTLDAPRGARVHYRGEDPRQGPMVKYTQIDFGEDPTRLFHDCR
ncbi:MAG TPA: DUF3182 family protein [Gammaproteobacteria bacterium]|nr:DUF3182 family protein [Gammaproteobacteria bacterium]